MLDTYLEVLLAIQDGDRDAEAIADRVGLSPEETLHTIGTLQRGGFLTSAHGEETVRMSPSGRDLLRLGVDEMYKRALVERLGGEPGSAS